MAGKTMHFAHSTALAAVWNVVLIAVAAAGGQLAVLADDRLSSAKSGAVAGSGAQAAQAPDKSKPALVAGEGKQTKSNRTPAAYLAECMGDWDLATHMTKQEWARTCRRVVDNRVKFELGQEKAGTKR